jgi:redox-sensitive bicupin YhaK (pirin superfamily)
MWENMLYPVASGQGISDAVTFHTDATIYRCSLNAGRSVTHKDTFGRRIFVYLNNAQISANDMVLKSKDQARIDIKESLTLYAEQDSELILIDVPSCKGWGYSADTLKGQEK